MSPLERRAAAAQATKDRFEFKPLKYGVRDCVRMTAFHLNQMGWGHKVKLPSYGSYCSARSGMRELRKRGFADLIEAMDSYGFARIPPAAALVADVIMCPAEGPFGGGLHIALGNGRTFSYHQDAIGADVLQPVEFVTAWRIWPL